MLLSEKNILYICHGNFNLLSRAKRQITSLQRMGYNVQVINGLFNKKIDYSDMLDYRIKTFVIGEGENKFLNQILLFKANLKIALNCRKEKFDVIICRELSILISGVLLKIFCGKKLVYDSNELSVETYFGIKKLIWCIIEYILIQFSDEIIHANEERKIFFINKYKIRRRKNNNHVVENFSNYIDSKQTHKKDDVIKLLYFGGLSNGRNIESLINAVNKIDSVFLDLIGYGSDEYLNSINCLISDHNRIKALPAIDDSQIENIFTDYHIGVAFYPNTQMNNRLCAPNKVWQYIQSGMAIITSNNPPLVNKIEKYKFGAYLHEITDSTLRNAIGKIIDERLWENINEEVKLKHSWNNIESKFIDIVIKNNIK